MLNSDIFSELKFKAYEFSQKRNWVRFHNPKNISMAISIEAAELMEIFQWWTTEESIQRPEETSVKDDIEGEIADIMIYILHLANSLDINLEKAVNTKLAFNELRFSSRVVSELENNNFQKK